VTGYGQILQGLADHAASLGVFDQVTTYEPTSAPLTAGSGGLGIAFYATGTWQLTGGLNIDGIVRITGARVYRSAVAAAGASSQPADGVISDAIDALYGAYCGDFTLGGLVTSIDLRGIHGVQADTTWGWALLPDDTTWRTATLTLPVICEDLWTEVA